MTVLVCNLDRTKDPRQVQQGWDACHGLATLQLGDVSRTYGRDHQLPQPTKRETLGIPQFCQVTDPEESCFSLPHRPSIPFHVSLILLNPSRALKVRLPEFRSSDHRRALLCFRFRVLTPTRVKYDLNPSAKAAPRCARGAKRSAYLAPITANGSPGAPAAYAVAPTAKTRTETRTTNKRRFTCYPPFVPMSEAISCTRRRCSDSRPFRPETATRTPKAASRNGG